MSKITLTNLVNLQNETTAVNAINANNAVLVAAMDNTLSRDGTVPDQMTNTLDMNSFNILNLPAPATANSPLRLQDLNTFIGGGSITGLPTGGTTGQVLEKNSGTNFDASWGNVGIGVVSGMGTGVATFLTTPNSANLAAAMTDETGTGANVFANSPSLTGVPLSTTAAVDTNTTQIATTAMVLAQASATNPIINGTVAIGTSTRFARADHVHPTDTTRQATLTAGQLPGEPSTGSASAGNVGEYVEGILGSGTPTSLVTGTNKTITSISLTAGDWDVDCVGAFIPAASTSITQITSSLSLVNNTVDVTAGRFCQLPMNATVSAGQGFSISVPPYRFSLSATTTIFLVCSANFTVSTLTSWGIIRARRAR